MKRKSVGKIQIAFGIIIFLMGVVGIILAFKFYGMSQEIIGASNGLDKAIKSFSNETQFIANMVYGGSTINGYLGLISPIVVLAALSIILIVLSITTFLQGLANTSEEGI